MKRTVILAVFLLASLALVVSGSGKALAQAQAPTVEPKKEEATKEAPKGPKKSYAISTIDPRAKQLKDKKVDTSNVKIVWRASDSWSGNINHVVFAHFADSVRVASGGRMELKLFPTGAIVGPFEVFDAVAKGNLDAAHTHGGFWKGKNEAFVALASYPFGPDYRDFTIWYFMGGGKELYQEIYGKFNLVAFPLGNGGQELGLHSKKRATKMEDFKGMKVRTIGWYMDLLTRMGISVVPLPPGEVYMALERGVIDAAELASPSMTYPMGFHEIAKYVIMPGLHQPSAQFELIINKQAWEKLPEDLKAIFEFCVYETHLWSLSYYEYLNIEALEGYKKAGVEFVKMDDATLNEFRMEAKKYTDELREKYPDVKKVMESQEKFLKDYAFWREMRMGVTAWPYEDYIKGKHYE